MERGPWHGWLNAEIYASFTDHHPLYGELNRALADAAELADALRVLDLACGTGATARTCLARLPGDATLLGVDASAPMAELARGRIRDPRARFIVAGAGALDDVLQGRFDRVVCNAAFWQFPALRPVIRSVAAHLEPGGLFVFNVPAERVAGAPTDLHAFQAALARAIEKVAGARLSEPPVVLDPDRLRTWFAEEGMDLESRSWAYRGRQSELMELMEIPAMIEPLTPGLGPEDRRRVLREARRSIDPEEPVVVPWVIFVARRRKDAGE